ncbi:MAG: hypothetical protein ACPHO4_13635, partial [Longimicrobiales bacterium]
MFIWHPYVSTYARLEGFVVIRKEVQVSGAPQYTDRPNHHAGFRARGWGAKTALGATGHLR